MQFAYQLLIAALTLLTTVSSSPNVSADLKAQATLVANQAIVYAQNVIQEQTTLTISTTTQVATPVITPIVPPIPSTSVIFGSVAPTIGVPTSLVVNLDSQPWPIYGGSCSLVVYWVKVLDQNGNSLENQPVSLTTSDNQSVFVATTTNQNGDIYAILRVWPQKLSGSFPITFTSQGISTTTTIDLLSMRDRLFNPDGSLIKGEARENVDTPNYVTIVASGDSFNTDTNMCR